MICTCRKLKMKAEVKLPSRALKHAPRYTVYCGSFNKGRQTLTQKSKGKFCLFINFSAKRTDFKKYDKEYKLHRTIPEKSLNKWTIVNTANVG